MKRQWLLIAIATAASAASSFAQQTGLGGVPTAGGGSGAVSTFSFPTTLGALFTCSTANPTTTPTVNCTVANTFANSVYGNFSGSTGAPGFSNAPVFSAAGLTNFPTLNQNTTGTAAGLSGPSTLPSGTTASTQSSGDNSTKVATDAFVLANSGGSGTVSSGPGGAVPKYTTSGTATTVGPSNVTVDSTGSNMNVPGAISTGNVLASVANLGADPCTGQTTNGNGMFCVDNFPTSCTVASVTYSTKLDCADATAIAYLTAPSGSPVLYFGSPNGYYVTNVGVLLAPASWTGNTAVSLRGSGESNTSILQNTSIATGTVYLPQPTGAGNNAKHFFIADLTIEAAWNAPYALEILGQHYQSYFQNLMLRDGATSNGLWGVSNVVNEWGYQDTFTNVWGINNGCPIASGCGSGATGTVSVSGGVPTITITAGGTNMDTNTQAWLVGYQGGTAANPCSSMGTIAVTTSGGAVTAATPTGFSGCSGTVYVVFDDDPQQFGLNFNYITDSTMTDVKSQSGYEAGVLVMHGENAFYHLHSFPVWGKFCVENRAQNTFDSLEMGECSLAELDNSGGAPIPIATVTGAAYNHSNSFTYYGQSMFRNEVSGDQIYAHDVFCNTTNANEYHTLVTPGGVIDSNSAAESTPGDEMHNVQYCGSGSGGTLNFTSRTFAAPSLTGLTTPLSTGQGGTGAGAISGIRQANGSSPDTAATSAQMQTAIGAGVYAPVASPAFTGAPTAPAFFPQSKSAKPYANYFDDFITTNGITSQQIGAPTGSSCVASTTYLDNTSPGNLSAVSGAGGSGTGIDCVGAGGAYYLFNAATAPNWTWESRVLVPVLPATTAGSYQAGMAHTWAASPWTTGIGFYLSSANTNANHWYCEYGSSPTLTDSTVSATTGWARLSLTDDGTYIHWWINGTEATACKTAVSSMPTAAIASAWTSVAGSSSSVTMAIDYVSFQMQVTR